MLSNRQVNYDLLRIMLSVMTLHTATATWGNVTRETNWFIINSYVTISHWGVPVFVMISGIIFLNPKKQISVKEIYIKYIKRILIAYILWSALYSIYNILTYGGNLITFITSTFSGHFHLWYLVMLIGLYMITPILRVFTRNLDEEVFKYWILLGWVFVVLIPLMRNIPIVNTILDINVKNINLSFLGGYVFYYIMGYYINNYDINKNIRKQIYILTILVSIFCIYINNFSVFNFDKRIYLLGPFDLGTALISISMLLLAKYNFNKFILNEKIKYLIIKISKYSFTMYLVHDFVNMFFYKMGFINTLFNPILSIPLISLCVFIVSLFISFLMNKMLNYIRIKILMFRGFIYE